MAKNTYNADIDLDNNQLLNARLQNLGVDPSSNLYEGKFWINSTSHVPKYYDGTEIKEFGKVYTFNSESFTNTNDVITLNIATDSTLGGVKIGSNININSTSGVISVADASTSTKGVIEIATDQEASTGTSETLAVNPKQLATKVTANNAITGATKCKITYDSKGLVTSGADLTASDIPDLTLSKITDVTASATELNYVDGVTSNIQEQINALSGRGRFLSIWNSTTGLPSTSPSTLPYVYHTGDYFIVGTVGTTNYKPTGTSYTGVASTTVETNDVSVNDTYTFDGTSWTLLHTEQPDIAWGSIVGTLSDQIDLKNALDAKAVASSYNNPALTASGGEVTWTITNTTNSVAAIVQVFEISTNKQIMCEIAVTASTITIKMNANANIAADTYRAITIG